MYDERLCFVMMSGHRKWVYMSEGLMERIAVILVVLHCGDLLDQTCRESNIFNDV